MSLFVAKWKQNIQDYNCKLLTNKQYRTTTASLRIN